MRYLFYVVILCLFMAITGPAAAVASSFSDVPSDHWCCEIIGELSDQNMLSGYFDGTFKPDQPVTRAEIAAMLVRFAGLSTSSNRVTNYNDMPGSHWALPFAEAVKPYLPGYVSATGESKFDPSAPARREDVVAAAARIHMGKTVVDTDVSILKQRFKDHGVISSTLSQAIGWAVRQGMVAGYPDGTFRPGNPVTRAEAAAILYRSFVQDLSINGLLAAGEIKPIYKTEPRFIELTEKLKRARGTLAFRASPVWELEYHTRSVDLYGGNGPKVLFTFINLNNDYFQWQGQWEPDKVRRLTEQVAMEVSAREPKQGVLVMVGHAFEITGIKDPDKLFDQAYLYRAGTGDVWRLERFYAGAVAVDRTIIETWVDD